MHILRFVVESGTQGVPWLYVILEYIVGAESFVVQNLQSPKMIK